MLLELSLRRGWRYIFCLFSEISRRIWLRRNLWIHDGIFSHPNKIVGEVEMALTDNKHATKAEDNQVGDLLDHRCLWVKRASGWTKDLKSLSFLITRR
jgi:hypothetical protein